MSSQSTLCPAERDAADQGALQGRAGDEERQVPSTRTAGTLAQSLDWARQCPVTSTVKVLTSVRVTTRAKMPSFHAKIKVNEAVAKMPLGAGGSARQLVQPPVKALSPSPTDTSSKIAARHIRTP